MDFLKECIWFSRMTFVSLDQFYSVNIQFIHTCHWRTKKTGHKREDVGHPESTGFARTFSCKWQQPNSKELKQNQEFIHPWKQYGWKVRLAPRTQMILPGCPGFCCSLWLASGPYNGHWLLMCDVDPGGNVATDNLRSTPSQLSYSRTKRKALIFPASI